eukprot:gene17627-biopygen17835
MTWKSTVIHACSCRWWNRRSPIRARAVDSHTLECGVGAATPTPDPQPLLCGFSRRKSSYFSRYSVRTSANDAPHPFRCVRMSSYIPASAATASRLFICWNFSLLMAPGGGLPDKCSIISTSGRPRVDVRVASKSSIPSWNTFALSHPRRRSTFFLVKLFRLVLSAILYVLVWSVS